MTDSSGSKIGEQGHYPYGEQWYAQSTTTKWQYTSYERDAESGNDYAMARYDVNRLGRFSAPDPLGGSTSDPQSLNRYAYTSNDPVNLIDPLGLRPNLTTTPTFIYWDCDWTGRRGSYWVDLGERSYSQPYEIMTCYAKGIWVGSVENDPLLRLRRAIKRALEALKNPKCRDLFSHGIDPTYLLEQIANGTPGGIGSIGIGDLGAPVTTTTVAGNVITTKTAETVAVTSAFLDPIYVGGTRTTAFGGAYITVNGNAQSAFSTGQYLPGSVNASYSFADATAATILHELGHAANMIYGAGSSAILNDQDNSAAGRINDILVFNDCFGGPK